jgi:hypothetical protein
MARTAQISKEKQQSIITSRHEGQSIWNISLKVSSSAVAKTIKHYDETGSHEDRYRKGSPRVTAPQIAAQINYSQSSSKGHINCSEEAAKKPLLNDTNKKILAWAKKHGQWTGVNLFFGLMSPNWRLLVPTAVYL